MACRTEVAVATGPVSFSTSLRLHERQLRGGNESVKGTIEAQGPLRSRILNQTEKEIRGMGRLRGRFETPSFPRIGGRRKEPVGHQQLDHPQVAFAVKQKRPNTMDEAVSATLEMESYLTQPRQIGVVAPVVMED